MSSITKLTHHRQESRQCFHWRLSDSQHRTVSLDLSCQTGAANQMDRIVVLDYSTKCHAIVDIRPRPIDVHQPAQPISPKSKTPILRISKTQLLYILTEN
jgi:hypothetical protein